MSRRRFLAIGAVCWLAAPISAVAQAQGTPSIATCSASLQLHLPSNGQLQLIVDHAGLLHVEERGQEIRVTGADDIVEIATPPRLGRFSVVVHAKQEIRILRSRPGKANGDVAIALDCQAGVEAMRMRAWETAVQKFERAIFAPLPADAFERLLPQLAAIRTGAAPGYAAALADHLRAQALLMSGHTVDASAAFEVARNSWLALGDRDRASAALVAQAEDMSRAGSYQQVLTLTRAVRGAPDASHYFAVRLENSRCLALEYLARLDESSSCYRWTLHALAELGETLERISTQQDYAQLERDRGYLDRAGALAGEALTAISAGEWDQVSGPDIPVVRGRVERLLSDLAVRRGDVAEGLFHSQRALSLFKKAQHARWQANTLLRIAAIYGQIGAYADADDAVDIALQSLSSRDAPARVAAAELTKADIQLAEGNEQPAAEHGARAEALYASLQMSADAAAAELTEAEAKLAAAEIDDARGILAKIGTVPPALINRAALDRAELSALQEKFASSEFDIAHLNQARPLVEWLRLQAVVAMRMQGTGQHEAALRLLERATMHISELASRAGNQILRIAIERQRRRLLGDALSITLADGRNDERIRTAWHWLLLTERVAAPIKAQEHSEVRAEFDRALAESLLPTTRQGGDKPRYVDERLQQRLLDLVANSREMARASPRPTIGDVPLSQFLKTLPCGTTFVAVLAARSSYVILAASSDAVQLRVVPQDAAALRRHAIALSRRVADHNNLSAIDDSAATLSQELLGVLDGLPTPKHLILFAPEPLNGLPWPLLHWPGSSAPMVETTAVSLVVPAQKTKRAAGGTPPTLHLFSAALDDASTQDGLPTLAGAGAELSAVAAAGRRRDWRIDASDTPTREAVLSALTDAGSWVHIAGHGSSNVEYLGRSGLWLVGPDGSRSRDLLSWVDVIEHGIRAYVVVLNACALGSSAQTSVSASIGFADALLHAGAHDVVAALWPINDTAAGLWASTFYAQLPAHPVSADIADALRASMLRLRESRAFRHPKYWASLVHLARLDLDAPPQRLAPNSRTLLLVDCSRR